MDNLATVIACVGLLLGMAAFVCSCVAISFIVGLKNSTHRIEWKTFDPHGNKSQEDEPEEEIDGEAMILDNPNKRVKKNKPFTPYPPESKTEEPFFDEEDPNNTSHDFE